jgi:virginiamycin B lyase
LWLSQKNPGKDYDRHFEVMEEVPMRRTILNVLLAIMFSIPAVQAEEVRYFEVQKGDRPHDVAPAPDGLIWYTGQGAGVLGRLDPKTGTVERIPLGNGSSPHGVIIGPDGAAWVTDGGLNAIMRVDATNKEVKTWPLPEARGYANLNTAAFDDQGRIWFTGQNGIYGRLDPKTGEMTVWDAPKGRGPYGITATPSGDIWWVSLAGNYLATVDPNTGEAKVVEPPTKDQGARRVWSDSKVNYGLASGTPAMSASSTLRTTVGRAGSFQARLPRHIRCM